jgi:formylmethanofuran dehydrogenase subunit E
VERERASPARRGQALAYKEIFWMACDSTEQVRAEYGPFHTRDEAEAEAKKLGFHYLLRYEHVLDEKEEIQEVRSISIELPGGAAAAAASTTLHTRCASCGESATHDKPWQAEVWADIHEFEHTRHKVRLFEHNRQNGLKEIGGWRG